MSGRAGRMQTVGAGLLVLAVTVAAPGLSIAQEEDPPTGPAPGAGVPDPSLEPGDPGAQAEQVEGEIEAQTTETEAVPAGDPGKPSARAAASKTVSVGDNFYKPAKITIDVGDTITWRNDGLADHTATADDGSFDTGTFGPGQRRSETFDAAGTIPYYCIIHGKAQSGTIKVRSAGGGGGGGGGGDGGGGTGGSTASGSEAAAVSSPGAAGSSSSLPATGVAALTLGAIGLALIGSGSALRRFDRPRRGSRLFSL